MNDFEVRASDGTITIVSSWVSLNLFSPRFHSLHIMKISGTIPSKKEKEAVKWRVWKLRTLVLQTR
jgi:hypothetical protein